jgi:hypothetical protein
MIDGVLIGRCAFYRVIARWKVSGQGERGSDSETLVAPVLRDGNKEWEAMGCGIFGGEEEEGVTQLHDTRGR